MLKEMQKRFEFLFKSYAKGLNSIKTLRKKRRSEIVCKRKKRIGTKRKKRIGTKMKGKKIKILPSYLKKKLRFPFGKLFTNKELIQFLFQHRQEFIIAVGDFVAFQLISSRISPDVIIYDLKNKRRRVKGAIRSVIAKFRSRQIIVRNPPSTISNELEKNMQFIKRGKPAKPVKVLVKGEEDLAALLAVIYAPINSFVLYGMPFKNRAVLVKVSYTNKKKAKKLFRLFKTK